MLVGPHMVCIILSMLDCSFVCQMVWIWDIDPMCMRGYRREIRRLHACKNDTYDDATNYGDNERCCQCLPDAFHCSVSAL